MRLYLFLFICMCGGFLEDMKINSNIVNCHYLRHPINPYSSILDFLYHSSINFPPSKFLLSSLSFILVGFFVLFCFCPCRFKQRLKCHALRMMAISQGTPLEAEKIRKWIFLTEHPEEIISANI